MDVRQAIFPYGMEKNDQGFWVFFNRSYKPVGMNTDEWIDFDKHPVAFKLKGVGPSTLAKLNIDGDGTASRIYYL